MPSSGSAALQRSDLDQAGSSHIHIPVRWRLGHDLLVWLRGEFPQLLRERDHAPDGDIVVAGALSPRPMRKTAIVDLGHS